MPDREPWFCLFLSSVRLSSSPEPFGQDLQLGEETTGVMSVAEEFEEIPHCPLNPDTSTIQDNMNSVIDNEGDVLLTDNFICDRNKVTFGDGLLLIHILD